MVALGPGTLLVIDRSSQHRIGSKRARNGGADRQVLSGLDAADRDGPALARKKITPRDVPRDAPAGRPVRARSPPGPVTLSMPPEQFIAKWKLSTLGERQAAQPHFLDLCELLSETKPEDPNNYCFERGALKASGRRGWADVWKRGHFAWEYKGKGANLESALAQLQQYALALENPPLLVVCDLERFLIVTNWTNTVSRRISLRLDDLADPAKREILKQVLSDPDRLKPVSAVSRSPPSGRCRWRASPATCAPAATSRSGWRSSWCGWSSACSRKVSGSCRDRCSPACWRQPSRTRPNGSVGGAAVPHHGHRRLARVRARALVRRRSVRRWRARAVGATDGPAPDHRDEAGSRTRVGGDRPLHPGHAVCPEPRPQADGGSVPQRRRAGFRGGDLPALVRAVHRSRQDHEDHRAGDRAAAGGGMGGRP